MDCGTCFLAEWVNANENEWGCKEKFCRSRNGSKLTFLRKDLNLFLFVDIEMEKMLFSLFLLFHFIYIKWGSAIDIQ
jgi:hypothetical protein